MKLWWMVLLAGCAGETSGGLSQSDAVLVADSNDSPRRDAAGPGDTGPGDTGPGDTGPGDTGPGDTSNDASRLLPGSVPVTGGACCLGLTPWRAVFQDSVGIQVLTASGVARIAADLLDASEPVLAGDTVIVTRGQAPERDLWRIDLATGSATPWQTGAGDQHSVSADGSRVVWIDGAGASAELWTANTDAPDDALRLTNDDAEQLWPHVRGDQVVWTDMRNDTDKMYVGSADDPNAALENNGDIYALTLGEAERQITNDPGKQARPAVEGEVVAWLDWRGISPEPKFKRFAVWARRGAEPERELGLSSWEQPALWQRPAVSDGAVLWVRETSAGAALERQLLDGGPAVLADGPALGSASAAAIPGLAAWVTGDQLVLLAVP